MVSNPVAAQFEAGLVKLDTSVLRFMAQISSEKAAKDDGTIWNYDSEVTGKS